MQTYLVNLQNNLPLVLTEFIIGIVFSCLLVGLIVAVRGRTKLNQLRTTLETENTAKQHENEQLTEDLNNAQQEMQQKDSHIESIEKQQHIDKNEASARILKLVSHTKQRNQQLTKLLNNLAQNIALEEPKRPVETNIWAETLWQRLNEVISQVTDRLISGAQIQGELEQTNKTSMAKLAEKESITETLEKTIDGQKEQISQLEQDFATQKSNIEQLDNKEKEIISANDKKQKENLARISALEMELDKIVKKLNIEQEKGLDVEKQLTSNASLLKQIDDVEKKTQLLEQELDEKTQELEQISVEKQSADKLIEKNKTLQTQFEQNNAKFVQRLESFKQSFDLTLNDTQNKQSVWQQFDELISQLSQRLQIKEEAVAEKSNSLSAEDLTEKTSIKEQLEQTTEESENQTTKLKDEKFDVQEVMQQLDQHVLNPFKDQIDTTTEKVKHLSGGLKNFLSNKLNR